jgi:hypothetical protein
MYYSLVAWSRRTLGLNYPQSNGYTLMECVRLIPTFERSFMPFRNFCGGLDKLQFLETCLKGQLAQIFHKNDSLEVEISFFFNVMGHVISGSLLPQHGPSSSCGWRNGLQYGG